MAVNGLSGTVGDVYVITAFQADGVTPVNLTGLSSAKVSIKNQINTVLDVTPTNSSNVFTFSTTALTFPAGGAYYLQLILTYSGGNISKGQIIPIMITQSNE